MPTDHPLSPTPPHGSGMATPLAASDPLYNLNTHQYQNGYSTYPNHSLAPNHSQNLTPARDTTTSIAPADRYTSPAAGYPEGQTQNWEEAFEIQKLQRRREKVEEDLRGWRGGNGVPRSGYSKEAVPSNSYFGEGVTGVRGRHLPKEIVRIERDWSGGEVCQFEVNYPMELEGRITPHQWTEFITTINDHLITAYSVKGAVIDNLIAIATWWTSLLWKVSHFEQGLRRVENEIQQRNRDLFNPQGLNVQSPREFALQFLEIEYY